MSSVSFIIPTYNAGFHIRRCLESVRSQNYSQDKIEILISDGGSRDNTLNIAQKYNCKILYNQRRLSEYGVQLGMKNAIGEFLIPLAADNELVGCDWIQKVVTVFSDNEDISAVWGRLASGKDDPALNKYFELIQSDPLNWFLNKNLDKYIAKAQIYKGDCFIFRVDPTRPLVWGANGIVYKAEKIKAIWAQEGYLGDNDAFQSMIMQGNNKVAYFNHPFVYHHHVASLREWIKKWKRNYKLHFLDKLETRNLSWVFVSGFYLRLFVWLIYSLCPIISGIHSVYLILRDRSIYWIYHPLASLLETCVYTYITLTTPEGRELLKKRIWRNYAHLRNQCLSS